MAHKPVSIAPIEQRIEQELSGLQTRAAELRCALNVVREFTAELDDSSVPVADTTEVIKSPRIETRLDSASNQSFAPDSVAATDSGFAPLSPSRRPRRVGDATVNDVQVGHLSELTGYQEETA